MQATATIDYAPFNAALDSLHNAMIGKGNDVSTLLADETKFLIRAIVRSTPPMGKGGAKAIGEQAISNDLHKLISEAPPELFNEIGSKFGTKNIDTTVPGKGGKKLKLVWENLVANPADLPELHNHYRKKNGRPHSIRQAKDQWRAAIVVQKGDREPYIRQVQKHVGRWKAKWAYHGAELGDKKYPSWISNHFDYAKASATNIVKLDGENPTIIIGNKGPDFKRNLNAIQHAVEVRTKALATKLSRLLKDQGVNLGTTGKAQPGVAAKLREEGQSPD